MFFSKNVKNPGPQWRQNPVVVQWSGFMPPLECSRGVGFVFFSDLNAPWPSFSATFSSLKWFFLDFGAQFSFFPFFFRFGVLQGALRTLKNHEKHCTVIKNQSSADSKKYRPWHHFGRHLGSLFSSFWLLLGSLGLSWTTLGAYGGAEKPPRTEKRRSRTSLAAPEGPALSLVASFLSPSPLWVGAWAAK